MIKDHCLWRYKIRIESLKNNNYYENTDELKISFFLKTLEGNNQECEIDIRGELLLDTSVTIIYLYFLRILLKEFSIKSHLLLFSHDFYMCI